jgi:hypothetical protein
MIIQSASTTMTAMMIQVMVVEDIGSSSQLG